MQKKQIILFAVGMTAFLIGAGTLGFMGIRKIRRDLHRRELMKNNPVIEIPELHIKAPILEGTDQAVLKEGTGHFPDTGAIGEGNYCIAGHSSTLYKEYFNNLKNVQEGMEIKLYRVDKTYVSYYVTESFIVEPNETWILDDFGDTRVTLVTCTDTGEQRIIVTAKPKNDSNT